MHTISFGCRIDRSTGFNIFSAPTVFLGVHTEGLDHRFAFQEQSSNAMLLSASFTGVFHKGDIITPMYWGQAYNYFVTPWGGAYVLIVMHHAVP
jgi:hypothetical protein